MPNIPLLKQQVEVKSGISSDVSKSPTFSTASATSEFNTELQRRYAAIQQRGEATTKLEFQIANRIQEQLRMEDEKKASEMDTQFRQDANALLENPDTDSKGVPIGLLNREMENANGITTEFISKFDELKSKYMKSAENGDQVSFLDKSFKNHFDSIFDRVYKHEAHQKNQAYTAKMTTNLKQRVLDANGITNPEAVSKLMDESSAIVRTMGVRQGLPENAIQFNDELTKSEIAKNAVAGLIETDIHAAQRMYDSVKDKLSEQHQQDIQDILYGKGLEQKALYRFYSLRNMRLPDMSYDYRNAQQAIMNDPSIPEHEKLRIWGSVKSLMAEDESISNKNKAASLNEFINNVYKAKSDGKSMSEAMRLVTKADGQDSSFAVDNKEQAEREDVVRKIYTRNIESNPDIRMNLWLKIQGNSATNDELDEARRKEQISVSDWYTLKKELYTVKTLGVSVEDKATLQHIINLGKRNISSSKERELYKWEAIQQTKGMPANEARKKAEELIQPDPNTGIWGINQKKRYQTSAKKRDADAKEYEQLNLSVGKEVIDAIGEGFLKKQDDWGLNEIKQFMNEFDGKENFEIGMPLNNLIRAMKKNGNSVTIENLKKAIINNKGKLNRAGQNGK